MDKKMGDVNSLIIFIISVCSVLAVLNSEEIRPTDSREMEGMYLAVTRDD